VGALGFSVNQAIMPVRASLPDTDASTEHPATISPLSPPCVGFFFKNPEEFVNNLTYISLMFEIHKNKL
jgi:hypothetical protein